MSTRASCTWKVGIRSASSMTTSGAPLPAVTAVWNLSYSSPPAPAFVQQTWTSSFWALKLSTIFSMFGYQAHKVTRGASLFLMVFVQLAALFPLAPLLPSPSSPPHPERAARSANEVAATAMTDLVFTGLFPFGCWKSFSVHRGPEPARVSKTSATCASPTMSATLYFQRCRTPSDCCQGNPKCFFRSTASCSGTCRVTHVARVRLRAGVCSCRG